MKYEDWNAVIEYFGIGNTDLRMEPRDNIVPGQMVSAVIPDGTERRIGQLKWRLVPSWSETDKTSFKTIKARAETSQENQTVSAQRIDGNHGGHQWRL